ncbi:hypothetical protein B0H17DRAFT_1146850 [Mycena rosella]|uniref:Uncharacterized protein n=1 Tax=Mycena rosella TaxID=1033263 RepID=A0AAD7G342_MYCRO|nr:hypothetical protein B0H17DRAFT_1146850 [Mycena rosella]
MPPVWTADEKQWGRTKRGSQAQSANFLGSTSRISGPTAHPLPRGKENTPVHRSSSYVVSSPYLTASVTFTHSDDVFLTLERWSTTYEKRCRNLTQKVSRATDRHTQALGCWLPRVASREVPKLGQQVAVPVDAEETCVESEEEADDAGYRERD